MSTECTAYTVAPVFETRAGEAHVDDHTPAGIVTTGLCASRLLDDERLTATILAYLDGELSPDHLAAFETVLRWDEELLQEVAFLGRFNHELKQLGENILAEPIPRVLVEALFSGGTAQ